MQGTENDEFRESATDNGHRSAGVTYKYIAVQTSYFNSVVLHRLIL